jgi:hypothetical protein
MFEPVRFVTGLTTTETAALGPVVFVLQVSETELGVAVSKFCAIPGTLHARARMSPGSSRVPKIVDDFIAKILFDTVDGE